MLFLMFVFFWCDDDDNEDYDEDDDDGDIRLFCRCLVVRRWLWFHSWRHSWKLHGGVSLAIIVDFSLL